MTDTVDPDDLEVDEDTFADEEPETDDSEALDEWAIELAEAVEAFGVEVLEPGTSA